MLLFWHEIKNEKQHQADHHEEKEGEMTWPFFSADVDVDNFQDIKPVRPSILTQSEKE